MYAEAGKMLKARRRGKRWPIAAVGARHSAALRKNFGIEAL